VTAPPRFRFLRVPEDADEGCCLIARVPSVDRDLLQERRYQDKMSWICDYDGSRLEPEERACVYCGRLREDCER